MTRTINDIVTRMHAKGVATLGKEFIEKESELMIKLDEMARDGEDNRKVIQELFKIYGRSPEFIVKGIRCALYGHDGAFGVAPYKGLLDGQTEYTPQRPVSQ